MKHITAATMSEKENCPKGCDASGSPGPFIGFYGLPVLLTYAGIVSAVIGICTAFRGELVLSMVCLIVSGFCDMTDGTVARSFSQRTEEEKSFGIQADSLADSVSFVVLPVAISLGMGNDGPLSIAVYAFYVLAGLIRLGYFNVLASRSGIEYYTGLPVSAVCAAFPVIWIARQFAEGLPVALFDAAMVLMALLFISRIRINKLTRTGQAVLGALAAAGIAVILLLG
ncbi:MAG: CDP-alcohol phosphatidyltransferase family protein [Candidatus Methanomethylophilaceae archaeon]|nr:CDP-alcohol phosphatidyltransferase family protein [Candidatus Methanomethylophilaceae archaeon]